jgi:DNA helicase HerA-like ATPase
MTPDDRRRAIGKVVSVAADRLVIELHGSTDNFTVVGFDDVHYVARLGSFLLVPVRTEYVVCEVVGLRERDATAGRASRGAEEELDKASSAKFLDLVPVGMLSAAKDGQFRFGVSTFPSLYADALYALDDELDRIFEVKDAVSPVKLGGQESWFQAIGIGKSVVFEGYEVKVRVDEFFGGHAAVLGNTGSGKSCTVAAVMQALFSKADEYKARGATFVIYDVNGEYGHAMQELPKSGIGVKQLVLDGSGVAGKLQLPHWFLIPEEWELLLRASERTQQPVLRTALGLATLFTAGGDAERVRIQNHVLAKCIAQILNDDSSSPSKTDRITGILSVYSTDDINLDALRDGLRISFGQMADMPGIHHFIAQYRLEEVTLPTYRSTPFPFDSLELALDLALLYEEAHGNNQIRDYYAQMITRYKSLRDREDLAFLRHGGQPESLSGYLANVLGLAKNREGWRKSHQVIVIDMNDVEDEVVELVVAVISRMIFHLLRGASPRNRFPVNLVLEEAHRYIAERPASHAIDASRIFERIAKEGRKYGVSLFVASQRPSELSKTVLSQCSNFVVHRIQNPDDLTHIRQMTPFISESVLRRLPSLPKQHALVFGNSVSLPTTFKVRDAHPRPESGDAKIRELWFHVAEQDAEIVLPKG